MFSISDLIIFPVRFVVFENSDKRKAKAIPKGVLYYNSKVHTHKKNPTIIMQMLAPIIFTEGIVVDFVFK